MRKKWLLLLCLLVIIGAAALWMWSARQTETLPSLLLPDSNRVHLVAVTVGTNVKMNFGTPIERVLARLPGKLGKRFKVNEVSAVSHMSPGSDIVLWFRYDRPAQPGTYLRAKVVDDAEPIRAPTFSSHARTLSNGVTVAHCGTPLWPRRKRTLTFSLEQASQGSHEGTAIGELIVDNPAYANFPIWVPEKLPATRNYNNNTFALESAGRQHETRVRVTFGGVADTRWEIWGHWMCDATGNFMTRLDDPMRGPVRHTADPRGVIRIPTMWFGMPKEPAWKIGLYFVRGGDLASNEVFVLRGVPAISTGSWPPATWKTNLPAGVVQLRHQLDWEDGSRKPCVVSYGPESFDPTNPRQNPLAITILGAVNETGQRIPAVDGRKIHIPPGSKTLDITIAIPPQHWVEYTVDPQAFDESMSVPDYLKIPDSIRPEKIRKELEK